MATFGSALISPGVATTFAALQQIPTVGITPAAELAGLISPEAAAVGLAAQNGTSAYLDGPDVGGYSGRASRRDPNALFADGGVPGAAPASLNISDAVIMSKLPPFLVDRTGGLAIFQDQSTLVNLLDGSLARTKPFYGNDRAWGSTDFRSVRATYSDFFDSSVILVHSAEWMLPDGQYAQYTVNYKYSPVGILSGISLSRINYRREGEAVVDDSAVRDLHGTYNPSENIVTVDYSSNKSFVFGAPVIKNIGAIPKDVIDLAKLPPFLLVDGSVKLFTNQKELERAVENYYKSVTTRGADEFWGSTDFKAAGLWFNYRDYSVFEVRSDPWLVPGTANQYAQYRVTYRFDAKGWPAMDDAIDVAEYKFRKVDDNVARGVFSFLSRQSVAIIDDSVMTRRVLTYSTRHGFDNLRLVYDHADPARVADAFPGSKIARGK